MRALEQRFPQVAQQFEPKHLGLILWAYATLQLPAGDALRELAPRVEALAHAFRGLSVFQAMWAYGELRVMPEESVDRAWAALERRALALVALASEKDGGFEARHLSLLLRAFANLARTLDENLLHGIHERLRASAGSLSAGVLCDVMGTLASSDTP